MREITLSQWCFQMLFVNRMVTWIGFCPMNEVSNVDWHRGGQQAVVKKPLSIEIGFTKNSSRRFFLLARWLKR